ncbi:TPA: hypothetical protein N0F65_006940 [Lagenidium giganteum]|uniref:Uncharacterized protein n=1 Tax=Lagenidium giganteum TaxID=4803 RepID=A0AAV2ZKF4_9STRA|nr:TPA: hypothetical protein N0F65_006940 [Lagenidium giganteum]
MASLSEEEQELIRKDREENPGCFYSTSLSQSCRSINGESKCEIIKKIFRQCPGKPKDLISNRQEVTEDEHAGADFAGDFFNRERMDSQRSEFGDGGFGFFDPFRRREDDFEAQRQEMLRPFESFFGGGFFGSGGGNLFEGMEDEFSRMPAPPRSNGPFSAPPHRSTPPSNPPHYSFHPSQDRSGDGRGKARGEEKKDIFEGYTGRVEEI